MNDQVKVPNPYLAAIRHNRASSVEPAHTLATALDKAVSAMRRCAGAIRSQRSRIRVIRKGPLLTFTLRQPLP